MTVRLSTGLRNAMLGTVGYAEALKNGSIEIRTGPQPLSADGAVSGTLLARITKDGGAWSAGTATNGLSLDTAANGTVSKPASDTWRGTAVATGVAGWWRFISNSASDNGGTSTSMARMDGTCGVGGAGDLSLGTLNIETGKPVSVDQFAFSLPAA